MSKKNEIIKQAESDRRKVAIDAAKGLVTGGLGGAVKGATVSALKSQTGKRVGKLAIVLTLVSVVAVCALVMTLMNVVVSQDTEASAETSKNNISLATMSTDVADDQQANVDTVMATSQGVHWEIMVALWKTQSTSSGGYGDYQVTKEAVDRKELSKEDAESLDAASKYLSTDLKRLLSDAGDKGVPSLDDGLMESMNDEGEWVRSVGSDDSSKDAAEYAKTTYVEAIGKLPLAGIKDHADDIYRLALGWRTGTKGAPQEVDNAPVCTPGDGSQGGVKIPEQYLDLVKEAAKISGFSPEIIAAQIYAESSWSPQATSGIAHGIAQFTDQTWKTYGNGGDVWDPKDAIPALGRYMKDIKKTVSKYGGGDEELITKLTLFGYHNGPYAISNAGGDYKKALAAGPKGEAYANKIMKAAKGEYSSDCDEKDNGGSQVPKGSIVETAGKLAWDHYVSLDYGLDIYAYGKAESRPEYVAAASKLSSDWHTAYFTDCGVFVSTVMRTSGEDPDFPKRGTGVMMGYVQNSNKYEFFKPNSMGELEPGDILIRYGHIFIYTGKRNDSPTGMFQGASLGRRPPSGHPAYLVDYDNNQHYVARLKEKK